MKLYFDLVVTLQQTTQQTRKLNLENETLKVELQLKGKKDEEITHLKQQLEQYQKDNLQLNSVQVCFVLFFNLLKISNAKNNNN
ncbi:hypothetical protein RFI_39247 [Reticulomyxa filosa]|uniref:Uncharacterized protein n=1 Tax=Reticulomyxa filosa TaxID=46433 RepID=X6L9Q6_RETFI|nr:hypothetical protein RFI_39247 [Reticulomyxa filosa]|eukprot:ETN98263.1 hypothetical protein RFI_39247 [Reticulomyxa filosa]